MVGPDSVRGVQNKTTYVVRGDSAIYRRRFRGSMDLPGYELTLHPFTSLRILREIALAHSPLPDSEKNLLIQHLACLF